MLNIAPLKTYVSSQVEDSWFPHVFSPYSCLFPVSLAQIWPDCCTADIFHSGPFICDVQCRAEARASYSGYASLSEPQPAERLEDIRGRVTYYCWIKSSAAKLLQILSGHAPMTAKRKWQAVSQGVCRHMDLFTARRCTGQIGEPELITYLLKGCEVTYRNCTLTSQTRKYNCFKKKKKILLKEQILGSIIASRFCGP